MRFCGNFVKKRQFFFYHSKEMPKKTVPDMAGQEKPLFRLYRFWLVWYNSRKEGAA